MAWLHLFRCLLPMGLTLVPSVPLPQLVTSMATAVLAGLKLRCLLFAIMRRLHGDAVLS
jgi:hypothetical protein